MTTVTDGSMVATRTENRHGGRETEEEKAIRKTKQQPSEKVATHPIKKIVELETQLTEHIRLEKKLKERKKAL